MKRQSAISVSRPPLETIARRHRCEVCQVVFECWLCTIHFDCKMHSRGNKCKDETLPVFVCEDCIDTNNCAFVLIEDRSKGLYDPANPRTRWWNYRTGQQITSAQRGIAESAEVRRKRHRKAFIHSVYSKKQ